VTLANPFSHSHNAFQKGAEWSEGIGSDFKKFVEKSRKKKEKIDMLCQSGSFALGGTNIQMMMMSARRHWWWLVSSLIVAVSALRPPLQVRQRSAAPAAHGRVVVPFFPVVLSRSSSATSSSSSTSLTAAAAPAPASAAPDDELLTSTTTTTTPTTATTVVAFEDYAPSFLLDEDMTDDTSSSNNTITLELPKHKPMGCTVEESLADGAILFVSSIVPGSNAANAGLRVGDVVTGITGLFGLIESTDGMDVAALYVCWYLSSSSSIYTRCCVLLLLLAGFCFVFACWRSGAHDFCFHSFASMIHLCLQTNTGGESIGTGRVGPAGGTGYDRGRRPRPGLDRLVYQPRRVE
jgi:PDZ domain